MNGGRGGRDAVVVAVSRVVDSKQTKKQGEKKKLGSRESCLENFGRSVGRCSSGEEQLKVCNGIYITQAIV